MRVLFLAPWPSDAASTRLRVEQYLPYLRGHGVEPTVRPFMTPELFRMVYERGQTPRKVALVVLRSLSRLVDVVRASRCDAVFVHREAFPFGTTLVERVIRSTGVPIVLDFDDAIYLPTNTAAPNSFMRYLKRPRKVVDLIKMSSAVVVGNTYLHAYASQYNPQTVVIPTPVDTDVYRPRDDPSDRHHLTIGWIGSGTTSRYLDAIGEPLSRTLAKHSQVRLSIVGGYVQRFKGFPRVIQEAWQLKEELQWLRSFDIGLMPYPDNEWARGKCAFKALLYMSMGIPAVCSGVGMAEEIIRSGENGFLARTNDDWFEMLDALIQDPAARQRLGAAGRDLVCNHFSLQQHAPRLLTVLQSVVEGVPIAQSETMTRGWVGHAQPDVVH